MASPIFEYRVLLDYTPNIAYEQHMKQFSYKMESKIGELAEEGWIIDRMAQSESNSGLVLTVVMRRDIE